MGIDSTNRTKRVIIPSNPIPPEGSTGSERAVLVIEDNEVNRIMMKALFDGLNLPVEMASDGQEGLDKLLALQALDLTPPLVLMDIHMPVMNGIEAVKQIRKIEGFSELPVVALSADAFTEQQDRALQAGFTEYMTKPIDMEKIVKLINMYLMQSKDIKQINADIGEGFDSSRISELDFQTQVQLVNLFKEQVQESIQKLSKTISMQDREEIYRIAHYIKGTALNLGAVSLADICTTLQNRALEADMDQIVNLRDQMVEAYEQIYHVMSAYVDQLKITGVKEGE